MRRPRCVILVGRAFRARVSDRRAGALRRRYSHATRRRGRDARGAHPFFLRATSSWLALAVWPLPTMSGASSKSGRQRSGLRAVPERTWMSTRLRIARGFACMPRSPPIAQARQRRRPATTAHRQRRARCQRRRSWRSLQRWRLSAASLSWVVPQWRVASDRLFSEARGRKRPEEYHSTPERVLRLARAWARGACATAWSAAGPFP